MNIFQMFFLTYKFYKSDLYIVPNFGHAQCSIWWFLILTFIKTASLTTNHYLLVLAIFPRLKMTQFLSVSYLCLMYKLTFYSHCIWKCSFWYFLENTEIFLYYFFFFIQKMAELIVELIFPFWKQAVSVIYFWDCWL